MTLEEIRLRQLQGQYLTVPGGAKEVVRGLCGLQAQFLSNALHALRIRCNADMLPEGMVKGWTLRGAMHLFHVDDLPLLLHRDRKVKLRPCDTLAGDAQLSEERKRYFARHILECIAAGENTREELKAACAAQGMTDIESESLFDPWGGIVRALCEAGRICHVPQEKKCYRLCPEFEPMDRDAARLEMLRRYFAHYGPATLRDATYFFGWTQAEIRAYLPQLPLEQAECGGRIYYYFNAPLEAGELPRCIFLAGFDPLLMGHEKTESLFLPPEHLRGVFSLAGIVAPALLLRGRIVGKWKKTESRLNITLFEGISEADRAQVQNSAHGLWPELKKMEWK